jgi:hypothetical protein
MLWKTAAQLQPDVDPLILLFHQRTGEAVRTQLVEGGVLAPIMFY